MDHTLARNSKLAPAKVSRLAQALQYQNFEALRDVMRNQFGCRVLAFADLLFKEQELQE